jgi:transcriptional regulator with XRE-family HTH domain
MARKYSQLSQILRRLLFEKNMKVIDLARGIDMHVPTAHRIVTGKSTRPFKSSLEAMATYLEVSVAQLIGDEPLSTDITANSKSLAINEHTKNIPLIHWQSLDNEISLETAESSLLVTHVSEKSFALTMPDYSMEPLFQKDSTLIFDPEVSITDRNYLLVKLCASNNYIFRQLLIDGEQKLIKSLNPDISATSTRALGSDDKIIARLVESRNKL